MIAKLNNRNIRDVFLFNLDLSYNYNNLKNISDLINVMQLL